MLIFLLTDFILKGLMQLRNESDINPCISNIKSLIQLFLHPSFKILI